LTFVLAVCLLAFATLFVLGSSARAAAGSSAWGGLASASLAADSGSEVFARNKANGCGSGWNKGLVPDGRFKQPCNVHDNCYAAADAGGNYIKPFLIWNSKKNCDDAFKKGMYAKCKGDKACKAKAGTYYRAVRNLGNGAFKGARKKTCGMKKVVPAKDRKACLARIGREGGGFVDGGSGGGGGGGW
jgi:hypothetical protein